jgi:hypothetical protein
MRARIGRSPLARHEEPLDLPASPPSHVMRDVARAAHRVDELQELECELHFETDADHRVLVQVRDLDGHVLRTITPSEALGVLSGDPLRTSPPPS